MTISIRQLEQIVTGSGGKIEPDPMLGGYRLLMPGGMRLFGALTELAQLGLDSDDVQLWGGRTAWIKPEGVTE